MRISAAARRDIALVLRRSREAFGDAAATRYRRLLAAAVRDLADGAPPLARALPGPGAPFVLHLRHVRQAGSSRVASPRHILVFRASGGGIDVLRLLHDAMDVPARLRDGE